MPPAQRRTFNSAAAPKSPFFAPPESPADSLFSPSPSTPGAGNNSLFAGSTPAAKNIFGDVGSPDKSQLYAGSTPGPPPKHNGGIFGGQANGGGSVFGAGVARPNPFGGAAPPLNASQGAGIFGGTAPASNSQFPSFAFNAPKQGGVLGSPAPSKSGGFGAQVPKSVAFADEEGEDDIYEDEVTQEMAAQVDDEMEEDEEIDDVLPTIDFHYEEGIPQDVLHEPGSLIIKVEEMMSELKTIMEPPSNDNMMLDTVLPSAEEKAEALTEMSRNLMTEIDSYRKGAMDGLRKASIVAHLLLALHHSPASTPEVLRKWLLRAHDLEFKRLYMSIKSFAPNPVVAADFWEVLQRLVLRGEVIEAVILLNKTDFEELLDGAPDPNLKFGNTIAATKRRYNEEEVHAISSAARILCEVLKHCPGRGRSTYQPSQEAIFPAPDVKADSHGSAADWRIFRARVAQASFDIRVFPGDGEEDLDEDSMSDFNPGSSYGIGSQQISFQDREAIRSSLPVEVNRPFRTIYNILHGKASAVVSAAETWEEAVTGCMMWTRNTNIHDNDDLEEGLDYGAMSPHDHYRLFRSRKTEELHRLKQVFCTVERDLPFDPTSQVQVACAAAMKCDVNAFALLPRLSLCVASTVMEIGGYAGWVPRLKGGGERNKNLMDAFDEEELQLIGMRGGVEELASELADDILKAYGSALCGVDILDPEAEIEGWEVGVGVLSRVEGGRELSGRILPDIPLTSPTRVDRLLEHCKESRLFQAYNKIATAYASSLSTSPSDTSLGSTLKYFSLAGESIRPQLHELTTALTEKTVLSSTPYPPEEECDDMLKTYIANPKEVTNDLLRLELSGYCAVRSFYAWKSGDEGTITRENERRALKSVVACIRSSGESVDGGIYDSDWQPVLEVRFLPFFLAEFLHFLSATNARDKSVKVKVDQRMVLDVLKVVTDFECAGAFVMGLAEETWDRRREMEGSWVEVEGRNWGVPEILRVVRLEAAKMIAGAWGDEW